MRDSTFILSERVTEPSVVISFNAHEQSSSKSAFPEDFSEAHHRLMSQKQLSAVAYNFIKNRDELPFLEAIAHKLPDELSKQKEFSNFFIPLISNLIFNKDIRTSIQTDPSILQGTYYYKGKLTNKSIAEEYGLPHRDILELCWNWN